MSCDELLSYLGRNAGVCGEVHLGKGFLPSAAHGPGWHVPTLNKGQATTMDTRWGLTPTERLKRISGLTTLDLMSSHFMSPSSSLGYLALTDPQTLCTPLHFSSSTRTIGE